MESRTPVTSANARIETQAPFFTKLSAALAWRTSSRVMSRSRTLVSTARIALSHMLANSLLKLFEGLTGWRTLREKRLVNVFRSEAPRSPYDHPFAVFFPFQN